MGLPAPKRSKSLELPPAPPLSEEEEFNAFFEQSQSWEETYFFELNRHAADLQDLGMSGRSYKAAIEARGLDLESAMGGRPTVPEHLRERWTAYRDRIMEPARKKIERAADEQIRREQNQRDLEGLADLHERGATKGHPLEPLLNKLFEEKEQDNGSTIKERIR